MKHKYLKDVVSLSINIDMCVGCGLCETVCPHGVYGIANKKAVMMDKNSCMECGACALNCPTKALAVEPGVGCAAAFIKGWVKGTAPMCDCVSDLE